MTKAKIKNQADVEVINSGSLVLFHPRTKQAKTWIKENVIDALWFGDSLTCEPRYARNLANGMQADGLRVAL